jgi:hypothetical protein
MEMDRAISDACALLLGPQARAAGDRLLNSLSAEEVKRAFRRVALVTHPDTAPADEGVAGSRFVEALWAYELLTDFLRRRSSGAGVRPAPAAARPASPRPAAGTGQLYHRGPLPRRRLRFAEFLYYSGCVSWRSVVDSMVWQRVGRPKFGEIARQFHVLTAEDLLAVLRAKSPCEPTGQAASRLHLLSAEEVAAVLRRQRAIQKPIGNYFLEKQQMSRDQLVRSLISLYRHNGRYQDLSGRDGR